LSRGTELCANQEAATLVSERRREKKEKGQADVFYEIKRRERNKQFSGRKKA